MKNALSNFLLQFRPRYIAPDSRTEDGIAPEIVAYSDRVSLISEQYRSICAKLLLSDPSNKVTLITSSQPREGKTTTACNLAATFSSTLNLKTVLIDGDLRRPRLNELLGIEKKPGLSDLITEKISLDTFTKQPAVRDLYVIPAGTSSDIPEILLNSERLGEIIAELKQSFDRIIIDSSPVLKTADVLTLGPLCDTTVFIVQARVTPRHMIEESLSILKGTNAAPTACIMTNTERVPNYYSLFSSPQYRSHYLEPGSYYGQN